jgi:hypothetical protein
MGMAIFGSLLMHLAKSELSWPTLCVQAGASAVVIAKTAIRKLRVILNTHSFTLEFPF